MTTNSFNSILYSQSLSLSNFDTRHTEFMSGTSTQYLPTQTTEITAKRSHTFQQ